MGLSLSKRVSQTLTNSPDFSSTCTSVYQHCLALAQHAFPGVQPYQLSHATSLLHHSLASTHPILKNWLPSPPPRARIDRAYRHVIAQRGRPEKVQEPRLGSARQEPCLGRGRPEEEGQEPCLGRPEKEGQDYLGPADDGQEPSLGPAEFRTFAVEVFAGAVVDNAAAAVARRVPVGVAGIVGVGVGVRARKDLVGILVGVYSVGIAASVYLSLLAG